MNKIIYYIYFVYVLQIVAPKREKLAAAEKEVSERLAVVEERRKELRILEEKLEDLQRRYSLSCKEKEKLENEQKLCALKLERAEKLISKFNCIIKLKMITPCLWI